nr:E3 ubiquitin-protein ligase UPL5-like isoform X1 [Coffea arabica]
MSSRLETIHNWTVSTTTAANSIKRKLDDFHSDSDDSDDDDLFSLGNSFFPALARMRKDHLAPSFTCPRPLLPSQPSRSSSPSSSESSAAAVASSDEDDSSGGGSSASSSSSSFFAPGLQFFVRMLSGGKTLVIHADPSDSVKSVHEKIQSVTRIPIEEQRLIYRGKQLQWEQSLSECDVQNDTGLQLVSRMRSTRHPNAWHCVDDMLSKILHLYKGDRTRPVGPTVKSRLAEFLNDIPQKDEDVESSISYLQIFLSSSVPAALVMLYLSPVKSNRDCADDCIKHFIQNCKTFCKGQVYGHLAHLVLEFCKLLGRGAGIEDPLYNTCRSCLGSMVEYVGFGGRETKMSKDGGIAVIEIFPFLRELAGRLSQGLASSLESSTGGGPAVGDVLDFVAFSFPIRNTIAFHLGINRRRAAAGGGGIAGQCNVPYYADEIKSLRVIFDDLLGKMDLCLKKLEEHLAAAEKGKGEHLLPGWCQYLTILKELGSISKLYKGAEEIFWTHMGQRKVALCYLVLKFAKRSDDNDWITDHKEVTNFEVRRHLAMMLLPEVKDDYEELHEMLIDRSQLLSESFEYIANAASDSLRAGLFMEFKNEEATGPGVLREWFFLVCQEIFNPQNALFKACPKDRRRFFPNPASKVNPLHLDYYKFCGRVIALALMHKIQVGIVLDRAFVLQLAGKGVSLEDIQDVDPYLYNSCKQILEMDPEVVDQDVLGLTFVQEVEELGTRKVIELCPDGQNIVVNSKNRKKYVDFLIEHRFVTSISEPVRKFGEGFSNIMSGSSIHIHKSFFQSLEPEDLNWMLRGSENAISVEDWIAHTELNGYKDTDPQISWFWKIVEQMSAEQKKILLFFWTSIKHLPIEGFGGLASKLYIYRTLEPNDRLPSSHTCFYRLCFPPYPSMPIMQDRLSLITQEHVGCSFGTW